MPVLSNDFASLPVTGRGAKWFLGIVFL